MSKDFIGFMWFVASFATLVFFFSENYPAAIWAANAAFAYARLYNKE